MNIFTLKGDNQSQETFKLGQFCKFNYKLVQSYIYINESVKFTNDTKIVTNEDEDFVNFEVIFNVL